MTTQRWRALSEAELRTKVPASGAPSLVNTIGSSYNIYPPRFPDDSRDQMIRVLRSEEHTSELQSLRHLVCRLLLENKNELTGDDAIHFSMATWVMHSRLSSLRHAAIPDRWISSALSISSDRPDARSAQEHAT